MQPECLNRYFIESLQSSFSFSNNPGHCVQLGYGFSFINVTSSEVFNALNKIKSNAMGLDGIPLRFIKLLLQFLLPYITYIFNKILTSSQYPSAWKSAKVVPVHKNTKSYETKDYRPISILPALYKAFETIMHTQISKYLCDNDLLRSVQSGAP